MTLTDRRLWDLEATEDTTSWGASTSRKLVTVGTVGPSNRRRTFEGQRELLSWLVTWGPMMGTREEQASVLSRLEEMQTDVTSWAIYEGTMEGLQGVVAVQRRRPELFRMTLDISPASLPRRQPRFTFLDHRGPDDDE